MKMNSVRFQFAAVGLLLTVGSLAFGQQTGTMKVKTTTGRAGVFVDDKYVGPAANFGMSRSYALPAGDHTITLREPRYETATAHVTIVAGKTVTVRQELKARPEPKGPFGRLRTEGERSMQPYTSTALTWVTRTNSTTSCRACCCRRDITP